MEWQMPARQQTIKSNYYFTVYKFFSLLILLPILNKIITIIKKCR